MANVLLIDTAKVNAEANSKWCVEGNPLYKNDGTYFETREVAVLFGTDGQFLVIDNECVGGFYKAGDKVKFPFYSRRKTAEGTSIGIMPSFDLQMDVEDLKDYAKSDKVDWANWVHYFGHPTHSRMNSNWAGLKSAIKKIGCKVKLPKWEKTNG